MFVNYGLIRGNILVNVLYIQRSGPEDSDLMRNLNLCFAPRDVFLIVLMWTCQVMIDPYFSRSSSNLSNPF